MEDTGEEANRLVMWALENVLRLTTEEANAMLDQIAEYRSSAIYTHTHTYK